MLQIHLKHIGRNKKIEDFSLFDALILPYFAKKIKSCTPFPAGVLSISRQVKGEDRMDNITAKVSCFARAYHYKHNSETGRIFSDSMAAPKGVNYILADRDKSIQSMV